MQVHQAFRPLLVPVAAAMLLAAGCGGDTNTPTATTPAPSPSESSPAAGGTVNVTEKDFSIAVDPTSATAGTVDFAISNEGPSVHEFVVFKTDLAPDALPTSSDGSVDEEGEGVTHIDEKEDIAVGSSTTLDVTLDAGNYVLICNLPGHYASGMHVALTVA